MTCILLSAILLLAPTVMDTTNASGNHRLTTSSIDTFGVETSKYTRASFQNGRGLGAVGAHQELGLQFGPGHFNSLQQVSCKCATLSLTEGGSFLRLAVKAAERTLICRCCLYQGTSLRAFTLPDSGRFWTNLRQNRLHIRCLDVSRGQRRTT